MSLFVMDGSLTPSTFVCLLGIALLIAGSQWKLGVAVIVVGFLSALSQAMTDIQQEDKYEIWYRNMSAAEISDDLEALDEDVNVEVDDEKDNHRAKCLAALAVLAERWSSHEQHRKQGPSYHPHELETICQEAAYVVFRLYPNDDEAVAAAISLNALVANDEQVRERHLHEADVLGFNVPIGAMRTALKRTQALRNVPEREEQLSAELQRKACLLLGALANNDSEIATTIVDEGGLQAILEALQWYRFHEGVANWGLWAIFVLCYEHAGNKQELIRLGGIPVICLVMKHNVDSLEVSRHGTAILFDLLRQAQGDSLLNVARIRKIALNAGLHGVLANAMNKFESSREIVMMGQEMLVATGYQGEVPRYRPVSS